MERDFDTNGVFGSIGATGDPEQQPLNLVAISAGVSDPSSTRLLADRIAQKTLDMLQHGGHDATVGTIELGPIAVDIARAIVSGFPVGALPEAIERVAKADALIVSTPVYKAGISGLLKSFFDVLDNDLIVAKPVLLAATAGTARHALVVDDQLRPLMAFMRALPMPTSVFAAPEDWGAPALGERIDRAARELATLAASGVGKTIADGGWGAYQHQFAGNATRAEQTAADVDFSTDLMRLATGGSLSRRSV